MSIDRGVVTQPEVSFEQYLRTARSADLDFVEILLDGPTDRDWLERVVRGEVSVDVDGLSLVVHLPFEGLDLSAPSEEVRSAVVSELHRCHAVADAAGAETVVVHPTSLAWRKAHDTAFLRERVVTSLTDLAGAATDAGLDAALTVENVPGGVVPTSDFPDLLAETALSMTFDTGHARIDGFDDRELSEFCATHADRIAHVHLNDTRRPADEHLPVGSGTIDFVGLFDALPAGWDGTASLEVNTPNMAYIEHSASYLDRVLAETGYR
ncbi:sugar phosphate isomerase/epimerase family protein [Salinigranum salinum]|uniref:sugar phosphate isomerase/epimerase family protein n=1 Tax=Salinigranum salinum TaxID=1364937 RepID=UPI00126041FD|nr:sugar phosphate isomerase/epimerase family protein [Salinigranum salinum]